jgi:hypothetical protein
MIEAITGGAPHEVAVVAYGAVPYVLGYFAKSSVETQIALTKLRDCSSRFNATVDTVDFAIKMLDSSSKKHYRRAILLIGETRDHGSKMSMEDVVVELGVTDTVIYSIAFAPLKNEVVESMKHAGDAYKTTPPKKEPKKPPRLEDGLEGMSQIERPPKMNWPPEMTIIVNALKRNAASELAGLSGGEYATFSSQQNLEATLGRIANQIHNYYLLSYKPENPSYGLHTLKLRIPDHKDAVIQTRRNYWSGTPDQQK